MTFLKREPQRYLLSTSVLKRSDRKSLAKGGGEKDRREEKEDIKKLQDDDSPQIMLIEGEGKYVPVSLKQAERIAKRRDLKIIQLEDPSVAGKFKKPVYKLITGREFHEINIAKKSSKSVGGLKGEKLLSINGNIADHDLKGKLNNVEKWLRKGFQTKVTIASKGSSNEHMESIFAKIEKEVSTMQGRILQRREKLGHLKFYIAPPKVEKKNINKEDTGKITAVGSTNKDKEESG